MIRILVSGKYRKGSVAVTWRPKPYIARPYKKVNFSLEQFGFYPSLSLGSRPIANPKREALVRRIDAGGLGNVLM